MTSACVVGHLLRTVCRSEQFLRGENKAIYPSENVQCPFTCCFDVTLSIMQSLKINAVIWPQQPLRGLYDCTGSYGNLISGKNFQEPSITVSTKSSVNNTDD